LKQIHKRFTYANVMSSLAVFLVLGGATAIAAGQLGKNSVGAKQLKANAVTQAKIKKGAVTAAKLKAGSVGDAAIKGNAVTGEKVANGAITSSKIANGAITGEKVNLGTIGTVPNSATTNVVKGSRGTLSVGQEATALEYGPLKVIVRCEVPTAAPTVLSPHAFIASGTEGSVFSSWADGSNALGPATPEEERELNGYSWASSTGEYDYDSSSDIGVSASAAGGQSFNASLGLAAEKDSGTCWYWLNAMILG
jgi:hypothetical protein